MTLEASRKPSRPRGQAGRRLAVGLACASTLAWTTLTNAQGPGAALQASPKFVAEQGPRWAELKPAQQSVLKPLEREWGVISAPRKQKWLELAARYPKMTSPEQARISERMAEWVRMTPQERSQARLNFQEAKQLPAEDRQARWNAYQALTPEQRERLAARAAQPAQGEAAHKLGTPAPGRADKPAHESPQAKTNIVTNPSFEARPTPLSPTVVQARPGASTTLITKQPTPPSHQQTGLPKIAATPEFVNKATLLPQRGPQGAATRPAGADPVPNQ